MLFTQHFSEDEDFVGDSVACESTALCPAVPVRDGVPDKIVPSEAAPPSSHTSSQFERWVVPETNGVRSTSTYSSLASLDPRHRAFVYGVVVDVSFARQSTSGSADFFNSVR